MEKIKKRNYEATAECIVTEQVSAPEIVELFEDKKFYKWYKKRYLSNPYFRGDI